MDHSSSVQGKGQRSRWIVVEFIVTKVKTDALDFAKKTGKEKKMMIKFSDKTNNIITLLEDQAFEAATLDLA